MITSRSPAGAGRPTWSHAHGPTDHRGGPESSRAAHHLKWAERIERHGGELLEARLTQLAGEQPRHRFHVWELSGFLELLLAIRLPCDIVHAQAYSKEFAVVLKATATELKTPDTPSALAETHAPTELLAERGPLPEAVSVDSRKPYLSTPARACVSTRTTVMQACACRSSPRTCGSTSTCCGWPTPTS